MQYLIQNLSNSTGITFLLVALAASSLREGDMIYKNSETIVTEQRIVFMSIRVPDGPCGVVAAWIIAGDSCGIFLLELEEARAEPGFS